jgi:hypothetical protein
MSNFEQQLAQRAAVDAAIAAEKNKGRDDALDTVRGLCKRNGITMLEVMLMCLNIRRVHANMVRQWQRNELCVRLLLNVHVFLRNSYVSF